MSSRMIKILQSLKNAIFYWKFYLFEESDQFQHEKSTLIQTISTQ